MVLSQASSTASSSAVTGQSRLRGDQHPHDTLDPLQKADPLPQEEKQHETEDFLTDDQVSNKRAAEIQPPPEVLRSKMKEVMKDTTPQIAGTHLSREEKVLRQWFSWEFWQMIVLCTLTLFIFSEIVYPLAHFFRKSLVVDAAIFFLQMLSFMIVAAVFATPESAGASHATALATIMMAISFLIFLMAISMSWGERDKQKIKIDNDVGALFCPFSRAIAIFLIVQGVIDESHSDMGSLTLFVSMAALGIAFAIGDVVKDIMSYVMIRTKHVFIEDDFIHYQSELYQIKKISWRNTTVYRMKTRSMALIPNSKLAMCGINNQSKDDARVMEFDIPLPGETPGENLQTIVRETWALLRGLEETGFKALNGKTYECQIDVPKTGLYLGNINPGSGEAKEFPYIDLHMRLWGKYYYSKAPPWKEDCPEPSPEGRQLDWLVQWKYQVEWLIVEVKKIINRHSV